MIINGKPYCVWKYEEVLKEQLLITFLSQGGISLEDTRHLPINDRRILLSTLRQVSDEKRKRFEEAREKRRMAAQQGGNKRRRM